MRRPSTSERVWGWWEAAIAGQHPATRDGEPEAGYYKVRRWRGKPYWLAARIWLEPGEVCPETGELLSDETYRAEVDGQRVDPFARWLWIARYPITKDEFQWLMASRPLQPDSPPPTQAAQRERQKRQ